LDDIVAMEQPGILEFVHEHVEAALDPGLEGDDREGTGDEPARPEVSVDDVRAVYRAILVLTLSLSHAVVPNDGAAQTPELLA
jgi:hypothetical protein